MFEVMVGEVGRLAGKLVQGFTSPCPLCLHLSPFAATIGKARSHVKGMESALRQDLLE